MTRHGHVEEAKRIEQTLVRRINERYWEDKLSGDFLGMITEESSGIASILNDGLDHRGEDAAGWAVRGEGPGDVFPPIANTTAQ